MSIITFVKRWRYWIHDIMTNDGLVYRQYREIRKVNKRNDISFAKSAYEEICTLAMNKVPHYKGITLDSFPIVNKMDYITHPDEFINEDYGRFIANDGSLCVRGGGCI